MSPINSRKRNSRWFGFDAYDVEDRGYETPCWIYRKKPTWDGYCQMLMADGTQPKAHRAYYEHYVEAIPEGLTLDHLCRVRNCVNPGHLEPVTRAENNRRGMSPSAVGARQTHCIHGHPYDEANTYRTASGHRSCRACHRVWSREYAARKKVA